MSDFTELTQHHFDFLVQEHGFKCEVQSERLVTYDNGSTFFQIGRGLRGEVGLTFDRSPPTNYYPFEFYLKTFFPDEASRIDEHATSSKLELDVELGNLSSLLKTFGQSAIEGSADVFTQLDTKARETFE